MIRTIRRFFRRSSTINNEPLNRVSLIVIILIDIFILVNVFRGLTDISQWYINPSQSYPCYAEWQNYQSQTSQDKDFQIIESSLRYLTNNQPTVVETYQQGGVGHLGAVSSQCLEYAGYKDKLNNPDNQNILNTITQKQQGIDKLEQENSQIRQQYDSTLLEKIAGQPRDQSINLVDAAKAKQQLEQNNRNISAFKNQISELKAKLIAKPEIVAFLNTLNNQDRFKLVEAGYQKAAFWYPTIQFTFQALFLLPLIGISLSVYKMAQGKGYGLIGLIAWHLSVVFFVPLIFKLFEFLQFGVLFEFIFNLVSTIFGGLVFLVSYAYILVIPLIGFGIIKFFQKIVFNIQLQATSRVQKNRCIKCAKKMRADDTFCPHCGFYQYLECPNCHEMTYKYLPYCKQCGENLEVRS